MKLNTALRRLVLTGLLLLAVPAFAGVHFTTGLHITEDRPPEVIDMSGVGRETFGPAPGKQIHVFVLSGQSNMVGRGASRELPVELRRGNPGILLFAEGRWQPLKPTKLTFGPEVAFGQAMAEALPGETIGIVKQAVDEAGIQAWSREQAGRSGDGHEENLWLALTNKIHRALAAAPCELRGVAWVQGGADMLRADLGEDYLDHLEAFITDLRTELKAPDLPVVVGSYRTGLPDDLEPLRERFTSARPGAFAVLQAQFLIQQRLEQVRMVPLRGVPTMADNIHYNTEGQLRLGRLLAEGLLERIRTKGE